MGVYDGYNIIETRTLDECRRYHRILEHALQDSSLPPDIHAELANRLNKILLTEKALLRALEAEENEKKEVGEGSSSGETEGRSGRGSGGSSGTGAVRPKNQIRDDQEDDDDSLDDLETIALLFFLSESDINRPILPTEHSEINFSAAAAVATLLFNRRNGIAHLGETYAIEKNHSNEMPQMLPALERHASRMGANTMQLRVPSGTVGKFRGYQPVGKTSNHKGKSMQKIRKNLPPDQPTD